MEYGRLILILYLLAHMVVSKGENTWATIEYTHPVASLGSQCLAVGASKQR
jgi:hypothetical protein